MISRAIFALLLVCLASRAQGQGLDPGSCADSIIDLLFIVDQSGSICDGTPSDNRVTKSCDNFDLVKKFMTDAVDQLNVGPDNARISIVTYSSRVNTAVDFCELQDKPGAIARINGLLHEGGTTYTEDACEEADVQFCATSTGFTGACCDRPDVRDVVIILTDGVPTNPGRFRVPCARLQEDATVFTVGIGNVNDTILKELSSEPRELNLNYFTTPDFDQLGDILDGLLAVACQPLEVDCRKPVDLTFIVDVSGSIGEKNFRIMKSALTLIARELGANQTDPLQVQASLIKFSSNAEVLCHLSQTADIFNCIDRLTYDRGTTNTGDALDMAFEEVFTAANGDRADVENVVAIFTDGGSNDKIKTINAAIQAKKRMSVIVYGLGNFLDEYELMAISSDPHTIFYNHVDEYADLLAPEFLTNLRRFVCNNENFCQPNPCMNNGVCLDRPGRYQCRCAAGYSGPNCEYFCREPCYVGIALDASGSIGKANFLTSVDFAKEIVKNMPIGSASDDMTAAMLTYSTDVHEYFGLKDYNTKAGTLDAMSIPFYRGGTTNTADAIGRMNRFIYSPQNVDDRQKRKCGVVITDGRSNDPAATFRESIQIRSNDVNMVAVGIGPNVRDRELHSIASSPTSQNTFYANTFADLPNLVGGIRDALCNANNECVPNPCLNGGECTDLMNGYRCSCSAGWTGTNCERRCSGEMDLLLVIDVSGSIRRERMGDMIDLISSVIMNLDVDGGAVRVAAISFSDQASVEFYFDQYMSAQDIATALQGIMYQNGRTNIAHALEVACKTDVFGGTRGDRANVADHIILFSDGGHNIREDETWRMATDCKVQDRQISVAYVGQNVDMIGLSFIASYPANMNVRGVNSFNDIMDLTDQLIDTTCNSVDECATNPCRNGGTCINGYYDYFCVCGASNTGRNCERGQCNMNNDVLFILDLSGSHEEVCEWGMTIIMDIIYGINFAFGNTRAALITYANEASIVYDLSDFSSKQDYITATGCGYTGGRTNTASALSRAADEIFNSQNGDRSNAPNKVILMSDSGSNINAQQTLPNAARLRDEAEICVFGIGAGVDKVETEAIASRITPSGQTTDSPCVNYIETAFEAETAANWWLDNNC